MNSKEVMNMYSRYFISKVLRYMLLGLVLPVALAVSCSKHLSDVTTSVGEDEVDGYVRFSLADDFSGETKASGITYDGDERPVVRWAVFVFSADESCVLRYSNLGPAESVSHRLRTGIYHVRAIANYPTSGAHAVDVSSIQRLSDFNGLSVGLEDNVRGAFVMAGTTNDDAVAQTSAGTFKVVKTEGEEAIDVVVHMKRLVSKVTISSVTLDFDNASLRTKDVVLKHVYLTNLYPLSRYSSDFSSAELTVAQNTWYNCMGWHYDGGLSVPASVDAITCDRNINVTLTKNGTTTIDRTFYFNPNPVLISDDSHAEAWVGPRCTRLILEIEVDGASYYWQCSLPKSNTYAPIVRNMAYSVSGVAHTLGSRDPEQEIPPSIDWTFTSLNNVEEDS